MTKKPESLTEYQVEYPFTQKMVDLYGEQTLSWIPGASEEIYIYPDDVISAADGMGFVVYQEVSRHKPGKRYPERVFFTRHYVDPDGKRFGKSKLRITTASNFTRLLRGYQHEYKLTARTKEPTQ